VTLNMTRMRRLSVLWILLSTSISVFTGISFERASPAGTISFRAIYYGARCLLERTDPYKPSEFLRVYQAEGGRFPTAPARLHSFLRAVPICVNLPTTLFLITPLAMLPWRLALVLWWALLALSIVLAAFLVWDLSARYAPKVSLLLIGLLLANSQVLFIGANTAGVAVGFSVIAAWCFLKRKFVAAGVVCLALSLAIKPHDSGLVWLYFLLAGGALRRYAIQTLVLTVALCVPAVLWTSHVAPQWSQELRSNIAETSSHGDISDPGPDSVARKGTADVIIDLQSILSVFRDDPRFYNALSWLVCGSLLLLWSIATVRSNPSITNAFFALAAISALSMLATYHRPYDAKLLLLGIPACCMLWAQGGRIGRLAILLTTAAILVTGDIPLAVLAILIDNLNISALGLPGKVLSIGLVRPAPLALLAMAIFYLWLYVRNASLANRPVISERVPVARSGI
jgi:hypothetical protein